MSYAAIRHVTGELATETKLDQMQHNADIVRSREDVRVIACNPGLYLWADDVATTIASPEIQCRALYDFGGASVEFYSPVAGTITLRHALDGTEYTDISIFNKDISSLSDGAWHTWNLIMQWKNLSTGSSWTSYNPPEGYALTFPFYKTAEHDYLSMFAKAAVVRECEWWQGLNNQEQPTYVPTTARLAGLTIVSHRDTQVWW